MVREIYLFAKDIITEIEIINKITKDVTYEDFILNDEKTRAVVRSLEIIGEAVNNIPTMVTSKYKDIPWADIVGMRNKIAHDYFGVNYNIVWKTVKEDLPKVKPHFEKLYKDLLVEHNSK